MHTVYIRFYEELNDLLPEEKKKVRFEHHYLDRTSVKDLVESLGIPHTEIDLILVNSKSVGFDYIINDKDDISVYPVFESFDIKEVQHLRAKPLREQRFIADVHLGKLVRYLRMLGMDVNYEKHIGNEEIIKLSLEEQRTILTMDKNLLKRNEVSRGYIVRNSNPVKQVVEVVKRFQLQNQLKEYTRCLECNSLLRSVEKGKIEFRLHLKVKEHQNEFYICDNCDKIYWKGTHFERMKSLVQKIKDDL